MTGKAPIIVIGAGQSGQQICDSLRKGGYEGHLMLLGDEASLPYQRPPLSKKFLTGTLEAERLLLRPASYYEQQKIDVHLNARVDSIDRAACRLRLRSGEALAYSGLALATGTRIRPLTVPGAADANIHYVRSLADGERLAAALKNARRVAVIGGGFIGLEVAAIAREQGREVVLIEAFERLMARAVAPQVSAFYAELHRGHGVEVLLGTGVDAIRTVAGEHTVVTSTGAEYTVDLIVAGIGVVPNSELAEAAGLACRNGIVVDDCARTSDPLIVAAGDCTWHMNGFLQREIRLESVQNAVDQAKSAAASLLGQSSVYCQVPWFWSDQYDIKLQIAGIGMPHDQAVLRGDVSSGAFSVCYFRDGVLVGVDSLNKPAEHMAARKLLAQGTPLSAAQAGDTSVDLMQLARGA
ncbi:MAG: FAD-dependent oxidoreductase [Gammaproteobacteria bacterium]|nr:FAD-dependent oxidoreductase [Gammaproteobacteria bacterium]